nr:reverse transcriptase domain-containing protein [Tanacetum cinerariifolium]
MSSARIGRIVTRQIANAAKVVAVYEAKTYESYPTTTNVSCASLGRELWSPLTTRELAIRVEIVGNRFDKNLEVTVEFKNLRDPHIHKTFNGTEVEAKDEIIASTWNLVNRSLTSAKISPLSDTVPPIVDTRKASVAADALSRNERAKPLRVRALVMTINSNLPPKIHKAQVESLKKENVKDKNLHGMDKEVENRLDGTLCIMRRSGHYHLCQQMLDVSKDDGRLPEAIWLTEQLSRVHSTLYVSKLKKCMAEEPLAIPLDEIQVEDKLNIIEEPVEIMDREVKRLKKSRIPIVKVCWNSRRGPKFTWEREDQMQKKYPHFFTNSAPAAEHLDKFLHVTQSIKVNGVTDDALRLYLFLHSLTYHATAWFDRLPRNSINTFEQMAKMFLGKYFPPFIVTKLRNEITNFRQRPNESLFKAWERYKLSIDRYPNHNMLPVTQIDTFYNGLTLRHRDTINAAAEGTFMKRPQRNELSSSITFSSDTKIAALKAEMAEINKNLMRVLQVNQQVKAVTPNCETCGGPHSFSECLATVGNTQNVYVVGAYQGNSYQPQGNRNLLSYRSDNYLGPPGFNQNQNRNNQNKNFHNQNKNQGNDNPQGNNQGRNQFFQGASHGQNQPLAYQVPAYQALVYQALVHQSQIPQPQVVTTNEFTNFMKANDAILKNMQTNMTSLTNSNFELKNMFDQFMKMNTASSFSGTAYQGPTLPTTSSSPIVERETEATKDTVHPANNGSTKYVQPLVVLILNSEPVISPIIKPVASPVSAPKPNQRPLIPYPSRLHDQKLHDKANDQREKFFQIFKDLNFNISFADALILMPKFGPSIKSLLTNKDKLCELARTPLNEHCSAILLNKLPEKLGDLGKFLIPCDFPGMAKCLALANLGASINLIPLSVWNKLYLPDLSPTYMTLELSDRSIFCPVGVAEDVFVKVGFHFQAEFIVVDFDVDPRVPLILRRSFLKTKRAFIDVFEGELTLHVGKEAITFNLDQTSRYSANYNDMTANRIDVIDMACEEYSQEVLGFSDVIVSGNPTPYYEPIVSTTPSTLTPFGNSDFLLEEVDAFQAHEDDPTSPEVDQSYVDNEGDILLLEAFLNDDPSLPPPNQGNYLPQVHKELKICKAKSDKSSIDEPPEVELKDLPPHLEYVFLEGDDKLPVIIAKDLSVEEKTALITEDFKPAVQHQRIVNPKIHNVIKNEVLKLLDAGLIYPISDSPWVSLIHCIPKKGGFTVVENEENELISTCLVTGWRVCIDYQKLNEATHKDHFPLPFMDQMLERLAGNQYYCFPDDFFGYFQIPIDPKDQEKTKFTCPYETFAYRRMPFRLCNAPSMFQRCMMAIFHDMIEKTMKVFIEDFSVFRNSFQTCLSHLEKMLKRKLTEAPILIAPDWDMPFELMCDANDFAIGAILRQRQEKHFRLIHYASKTMTEAESNYITTEKEMLVVVYAFEKFRSYLIINKRIVYTDHSALKYLFAKKDSKARLLRWVLLLQEFTFKVIDTKGAENLTADHLSRLENPHQNVLDLKEINESFPFETLNLVSTRAYKTPIGCTLYKLVYGKAYHLLIELEHKAYWALKHANFDLQTAGDHRKVQLNELNELRNQAYENSLIYKEKTKRLHDSKIKHRVFNISDRVLFSSRLKIFSGKLKSRWSRPFTISHVFSYGTVELSQPDGPNFKVNGHRLKHYFREDVPKMVFPDLQTFHKDQ